MQDYATNSRGAVPIVRRGEVRARIVDYLLNIAPQEVMPKTIARVLRIPHNTAKSECMRILAESDSPIVRTRRGWYRHRMSLETVRGMPGQKRIGLHGIKLEARRNQDNTGYCLAGKYRYYNQRRYWKRLFNGHWVTITVHDWDLVEVWVNASKNPLDLPEFERFIGYVTGLLEFVPLSSWHLIQLGYNFDVCGLKLEGLKGARLDVASKAFMQIYQKGEDVVRMECHDVPRMGIVEAMMVFKQILEHPRNESYRPAEPDPDDYSVR